MSTDVDPVERAAYTWDQLTHELALMSTFTLTEAHALTYRLQFGLPLPGRTPDTLSDVVPYDMLQPLLRLLKGVQDGQPEAIGTNLRALLVHAQDAVRPQEEST